MNYSLDHKLLEHPYISELKGSHQLSTWLLYSMILHFTKHMGHADVNISKLEKAWHVKRTTINAAIEGLIAAELIQCVKPWQRKGNKPGVYKSQSTSPRGAKHYAHRHKALVPGDRVNNYNNYNEDNDYLHNQSSKSVVHPVGDEAQKHREEIRKALEEKKQREKEE